MRLRHHVKQTLVSMGVYPVVFRTREWLRCVMAEKPPEKDEHGIPIPPPYLMSVVVGDANWKSFLSSGERLIALFTEILARNKIDIGQVKRVLDFGCGCGRLIRHLPRRTKAKLAGCDYNDKLVSWCSGNLSIAEFKTNQLTPPCDYPDGAFDLIYLYSVFTHLDQDTQGKWLQEFNRMLAPGGHIVLTFHDETFLKRCQYPEMTKQKLDASGFAVENQILEGSNLMATFQTREYVGREFAKIFELIEIVPGHSTSATSQAIVLMKKRAL